MQQSPSDAQAPEPVAPQQQPVIRTYRGRERRSAEEAYRIDAAQAATAAWLPVAHRWTEDWQGHSLSVVFEYRGPAPSADQQRADTPSAGEPAADLGSGEQQADAAPAEQQADAGPEKGPADLEPADHEPYEQPADVSPQSAARAHATITMQAIDLHCAGEPLRLIRSGFPQVPFAPILERRQWAERHADEARRVAMHEPRGHRDMYGAILLPPFRADADVAVLFMHNDGFSTMCGHGIIAITTALLEERLFPVTLPETIIRYETPAGLVTARAQVRAAGWGGPEVERVRFSNVPSYLAARDISVRPEGIELPTRRPSDEGLEEEDEAGHAGTLSVDVAFGGAFYGIVDAADLGLRVVPEEIERLTRAGAAITEALRRDHRPDHPTDPELSFVYGTIIVERETDFDGDRAGARMRNVTVFADAEVDRSPCGSGTSALLAQAWARGTMTEGQEVLSTGLTGESFRGHVGGRTWIGQQEAVETTIEGRAFVTGYPSLLVDDRDPLGGGFLLA